MLKHLLLVFCLFAAPLLLPGQTFNLQTERMPMVELRGLCRFHTGDNPRWANPGFDDSQWPVARIDEPWIEQGYTIGSGFAWYRFQVLVPAGHPHLGIYVPATEDSYEIFVDGQRVAKEGGLPPKENSLYRDYGVDPVFPVPGKLIPAGRPVEVALRLWHWPYWTFEPAGLQSPLLIGDAQLLARQRDLRISYNLRSASGWNFLCAACLLAFVAGFALFLLRPGEFAYLWFAFSEIGLAAVALWNSYASVHAVEIRPWETWQALALLVFDICWPTFIVTFLKEPRRLLYWITVVFAVLVSLGFIPFLYQWIPAANWILVIYLLSIPSLAGFLLLIWIPARRGNLDAQLLLGPQALYLCAQALQGVIFFAEATGHYSLAHGWQNRYDALLTWPFRFSLQSLVDFLFQAAVLAIIILRFARTSREEERHAGELESARAVQQVLVPAENPSIPGFVIESVYLPAGEVGGDFYQAFATESGGALVVIGDVSGKGMPAAMTVSLLVGTFRTLAHYTRSPREILAAMNQRMIGRNSGGFTTCLILRADSDGTLTVANAGHIPPWLAGQELPLEGGLPLGLSAETSYSESTFSLAPGQLVTLVSDGVVEAQSATGELFGFERTRAISTQSADEIARAAQAFGQQDDITILTLQFAPAEVLHA